MKLACRLVAVALITLTAALLSTASADRAGAAPSAAASGQAQRSAQSTAQSSCPKGTVTGATCVTIPAHCSVDQFCQTVVARPTTNLASTQAVYLTLDNFFESTDPIYIQYCQDVKPLSVAPPLCVSEATATLTNPQVVLKALAASGSVQYAYQVLYLAKGSTPFQGVVPGTATHGTFLCDSQDPCSIDVTDPFDGPHGSASNLTPETDNTAVIPVSFAASQTGCPRATFLDSESEFGIDQLISATASSTCVHGHGVAVTNTDLDAPSAVAAFAAGSFPVVFTDTPSDPAEQSLLKSLNGQYAFIPIALSANVVSFDAIAQGQQGFPDPNFDLTPNMAAGAITDFYTASYSADVGRCDWLPAAEQDCPIMQDLNPVPGFEAPLEYGAYVRGDSSSPTYALFQWMCDAPHVPVRIGKHEVTEPWAASKVLDYAYEANDQTVPKTCPSTIDTFPDLTKAAPNFGTASTPATETEKIESFVPLPQDATSTPKAAFSDMSWPDALQYGLSVAALQNPSGDFVTPTRESLDAAASAMTLQKDGTYAIDYDTKNAAAYPMPDVWYALVSTKPQSASTAQSESALIANLLDVAGGKDVADLPNGYVPLPASWYHEAESDIAHDIVVSNSTGGGTTTTTTTLAPTSPPSTFVTPVTTPATTPPATTRTTTPAVTTTPPVTTRSSAHPQSLPTQLASFAIVGRTDAWLVPLLACIGSAAIIFGPGLFLWARRRTRKAVDHGGS